MTTQHSLRVVEALMNAIDSGMDDVRVSTIARVESFDASTRKISAQPVIREAEVSEEGERKAVRLPVITNIPLIIPGSGGGRVKFPVSKGDKVLLLFTDQSLDRWLTLGGDDVDPENDWRHSVHDAVAIPGVQDFKSAGDATPHIEFTEGGEIHYGGSTDAVVKGSTYRSAEDTMLTLIKAAFDKLAADAALDQATTGACTSAATAIADFLASASSYLSQINKVS